MDTPITLSQTYNIDTINIINRGQKYISAPNVTIINKILEGTDSSNGNNLVVIPALLSSNINDDYVSDIKVINHGDNYNPAFFEPTIYVGGKLISINDDSNLLYDIKSPIPSIFVYEFNNPYNSPVINVSFFNNLFCSWIVFQNQEPHLLLIYFLQFGI